MSNAHRERPHRLPHDQYLGERTIAFTSCLRGHHSLFVQDQPTVRFAEVLIEEADRHGCDLVLACFMPEHLHVLTRGRNEESDAIAAYDRFKLRTAVILDRFYRPTKWQKDYYDHIIRCEEDWRGRARYNALNPVRRGLVEDAYEYPYFFSSLDTKGEILAQIFWE